MSEITGGQAALLSPLVPVSSPEAQTHEALPNELISEATLRYIGYNDDTAAERWQYWTHWPAGSTGILAREVDDPVQGMSFLVYATGHAERPVGDAVGEDDLE